MSGEQRPPSAQCVGQRILVTGAGGFVGSVLVPKLSDFHEVVIATRKPKCGRLGGDDTAVRVVSPELSGSADWQSALEGIDVVIHLAAVAHMPVGSGRESEARMKVANVDGARRLAEQAKAAGVRRFIFMSSIKAVGESSGDKALDPEAVPCPEDAYGRAKLLAEEQIIEVSSGSSMETVILRPPLIYGPGSKGNFAMLASWIRRGLPLPFGRVNNSRSVVSAWNVAEVVRRSVDADIAGKTLHVADPEPLSTRELCEYIAEGMQVTCKFIAMPPEMLRYGLSVIGRHAMARRLFGSLVVDGSLTFRLLSWYPTCSTRGQIAKAVGLQK